MNRQQRRAAAARNRKVNERAEAIAYTCDYLANIAAPTATGATLFLPDGQRMYISADDARTLYGRRVPTSGHT